MSIKVIHLRKLLKIMYLPNNGQISALRNDIREDIAKENGAASAGGDFYGPFWKDAKDHAIGKADLHDAVDQRILSNPARSNLYPQLRDGFLLWWNERRRWTNAPFEEIIAPNARLHLPSLDANLKVDNFLAVRDARNINHYIYPYFSPSPILDKEAARIGLWVIGRALPSLNWDEVRILDVLRGNTFDVDRSPLQGNEESLLVRRYGALIQKWSDLRQEYS
ncbi:MAG: hypothetical protein EOO77_14390 [Oxalobacteraceae bacterium]|nr:MAG: hypothetical protein EOO77_14390 [Oxalobacteraceae bacterium]